MNDQMKQENDSCDELELDLILFSHLIPCCQNYLDSEDYEKLGGDTKELLNFELQMEERSKCENYKDISRFLSFLLSHPSNRLLPQLHKVERNIYSTIFPSTFTTFQHFSTERETTQQTQLMNRIYYYRWEKILSFMRNIFCHECSEQWRNVSQLSRAAKDFFQTRAEISNLIQLYYHCVLLPSK